MRYRGGFFSSLLLFACFFTAGCSLLAPQDVILEPVTNRAAPAEAVAPLHSGYLHVFSAAHIEGDSDLNNYVPNDYDILGNDGARLRHVSNSTGRSADGPATVTLSSGSYFVVADAAGLGVVRIPITIAEDRVTKIYLDRVVQTSSLSTNATIIRSRRGHIIGWIEEEPTTAVVR